MASESATGWIKPDDGIEVLDRNGNGLIDSGRELFGDNTVLSNGTKAGQLAANQNGISEAGELHTLAEAGVASIAAQGSATDVNLGNGNIQSFGATFVRTDGSSGDAGTTQLSGSLLLASSNFYRVFPDTIAHTAQAEALPDMQGSGWLRDLREAMSLGRRQGPIVHDAYNYNLILLGSAYRTKGSTRNPSVSFMPPRKGV